MPERSPRDAAAYLDRWADRRGGEGRGALASDGRKEATAIREEGERALSWYSGRERRLEATVSAWNRAAAWFVARGFPADAEVARSGSEGAAAELGRVQSGDAGGLRGVAEAVKDTVADVTESVGLGNPLDPNQSRDNRPPGQGPPAGRWLRWGAVAVAVVGVISFFGPGLVKTVGAALSTAREARAASTRS